MPDPNKRRPSEYAGARLLDGSDEVYILIVNGEVKPANIWVWHWHEPEHAHPRWQCAACSLHTIVQADPLTLSPSLACQEDGCPWHGHIENGAWRSV